MKKPIKKNKTTKTLLTIFLIIILPITAVFVFNSVKTLFSSEKTEDVQEEPKAGDSLSGIKHEDIVNEYKKQKKSSEAEGTNYINSLAGEEIVWIGTAMNVRADWINGKQYMVVSFTEKLIDTNLAYINVSPNPEYQEIPDMALIKVSGKIDRIEPFLESGINVYFEEASIEIVE